MEEQIIREWRAKGYTDRDWTRMKTLVFDENSKIKVMTIDEHKKQAKLEEQEIANSVMAMNKK